MKSALTFMAVLFGTSTPALAAQDIRDVKPPVPYPFAYGWLLVLLAALLLAAFAVLAWRYWRRAARKDAGKAVPLKPPHELAYGQLEALAAENLPARGLVKEYYIRLSDIVRRYVEGRFCIRAPEMTTEEFLLFLKTSSHLTGKHKNDLKAFLNSCDMVKFAKYGPGEREMNESFDLARRMVDETRERPQEPSVPPSRQPKEQR